jgi:hypothetical protein
MQPKSAKIMGMTPVKDTPNPTPQMREYMVRVTRRPLDPVKREQMRANGTLPEDYRSRSVDAHDFVTVNAADDARAAALALYETTLKFAGEDAEFHEVLPHGRGLRPLDKEA